MSNRTYLCHSCNRSNNYFQKYCGSRETPAAIACLRSTRNANLPIDFQDELSKLKSHLKISADLINKYQYGNPSAIKTRIRECRKDL